MKKILLVMIGALVLYSCEMGPSYGKLTGKSPVYSMKIEAENGDDTKAVVDFMIDDVLVDSLKLSEETINSMCRNACLYSNMGCKYPKTYKFDDSSISLLHYNEGRCSVMMHGSAKNAFGVEDNITTFIPFDSTYSVVSDEIFGM